METNRITSDQVSQAANGKMPNERTVHGKPPAVQQNRPTIFGIIAQFVLTLCDVWATIRPVVAIGVAILVSSLQEKETDNAGKRETDAGRNRPDAVSG